MFELYKLHSREPSTTVSIDERLIARIQYTLSFLPSISSINLTKDGLIMSVEVPCSDRHFEFDLGGKNQDLAELHISLRGQPPFLFSVFTNFTPLGDKRQLYVSPNQDPTIKFLIVSYFGHPAVTRLAALPLDNSGLAELFKSINLKDIENLNHTFFLANSRGKPHFVRNATEFCAAIRRDYLSLQGPSPEIGDHLIELDVPPENKYITFKLYLKSYKAGSGT